MSEQESLERRYRRLLACYPPRFRRENEEEILAVLLACAQDGQARPGLSASADLVKGAVRMWLRPPSRLPRTVAAAIRLMCAGAAAELAILITVAVTAGSIRSAVAHSVPAAELHGHPGLSAALAQAVNTHLLADEVGAPVCVVLWLWLAWALSRRQDPVRAGYAVFFFVLTMSMILALAGGAAVYGPAVMAVGGVVWVIGLAAMVLILTPASNRYYRPEPAAAAPWRGTFGTA